MTELANLQSLFQGYVVDGNNSAIPAFVGNESASAEERLDVYYEAYRLRLLEILRDDFSGLSAIMNTDAFNAIGLRYLDKFPSGHTSVRQFGRHLVEFLETDGGYSERPYLAEMARFEWARGLAFDGADAKIMTLEEFGALPAEDWPALHIQFHPTLHTTPCTWNIGPVWRAVNEEVPVPEPRRLDTPETLAVWRRGVTVYWRSMNAAETGAIDAFAQGQDFAGVCSVLCEWLEPEAVPAKIAGMLNQWVTEGLVAK